jgi:two-component system sensor histidine kinase TctE
MRSAYTLMEPVQKNRQTPVLIEVAETLEKRGLLANEIIKGVVLPQFVILPVALALVWFALTRGLSPVTELQKRIHARCPDDLSPVDTRVPEEITPLVESMNEMLQRVEQSIAVQKSFIADAAHQMKTPLAGMRCNQSWRCGRTIRRKSASCSNWQKAQKLPPV